MKQYTKCRIMKKRQLNAHTVSMEIAVDDMFQNGACGEFVHILCGQGHILRRPISICDFTADKAGDTLRIVFQARGEGTTWLSQRQEGDDLDIMGPLGNAFTLDSAGRYLLVGGGIGVPPLFHCAKKLDKRSDAILGFRGIDYLMMEDEFSASCRSVSICTDDGSYGYHGFVDAKLDEILSHDATYTGILACGPKGMLKSIVTVARRYNIPCQVSMEERMGCGVGACLVCACQMADQSVRHVCKDGPVFWAEEVCWDD